jgi:predicted dehydrogenase
MICSIVGAGGWGTRVARRLAQFDDVLISGVFDDDYQRAVVLANEIGAHALKDFQQHLDVSVPDVVVLAVPAGRRQSYVEACRAVPRVKKPRFRIEKPLGLSIVEAQRIADTCALANIDLTVGFTLLHHPLYDAAFQMIDACGYEPDRVRALRVGAPAAHDIDPMLDIGIHAASIAAHLGIPRERTDIRALYHSHAAARETTIVMRCGAVVHVDELALQVRSAAGTLHVADAHDALGCDLRAWLDSTHRGTPAVALAAQALVEPRDAAQVAA